MDDFDLILQNGINFGRGGEKPKEDGKVKTKAKKKKYITGAHGSGSAMQKAKYRESQQTQEVGHVTVINHELRVAICELSVMTLRTGKTKTIN